MATKEILARSATDYSGLIDHTLLKSDATPSHIQKLCQEAMEFHFFSVCINPSFISIAAEALRGSKVKVCTVIGFPLGAMTSQSKVQEAAEAINLGADELDMVMAIGRLKANELSYVEREIAAVVRVAEGRPVKVIIETSLLSSEEKRMACELAMSAKAQFVKTSTGFCGGGATVDDVRLMKSIVGDQLLVKASGGVRSLQALKDLVSAGASRIGTSQGPQIISAATADSEGY